jgi:hypothetical protein
MRKDIKKLELKKMFKEFGFLKLDEEYKTEFQKTFGPEFHRAIKQLFKSNPDLNLLFNTDPLGPNNFEQPGESSFISETKLLGDEIYNPTNELVIYSGKTTLEPQIEESQKSDAIKKLYRQIATKTHPDKVSVKFLNELYLKAQAAYDNNDIFSLYLICNDLDIEYEFPENELKTFKLEIDNLRNNNFYTEKTYLWAWANEEDETKKKNILLHFISKSYSIKKS